MVVVNGRLHTQTRRKVLLLLGGQHACYHIASVSVQMDRRRNADCCCNVHRYVPHVDGVRSYQRLILVLLRNLNLCVHCD